METLPNRELLPIWMLQNQFYEWSFHKYLHWVVESLILYSPGKTSSTWVATLSYDQLQSLARNNYGSRVYQRLFEHGDNSRSAILSLALFDDDTIPFGKYSCHVAATAAQTCVFYEIYAKELLR
eukprot:UN16784